MATLDTNCLLRWLLDDNPDQRAAVDRLIETSAPLTIPDTALVEVVFVLERVKRQRRSIVVEAIEALTAEPALSFDRAKWSQICQHYIAHPKLSIADILMAVDAEQHQKGPLVTFDQKLASQLPGVQLLKTQGLSM